jgi:hypothetical protein
MIELIISGGQTGVDRAALDWAIANSIPHGGWCPLGCRAEDGAIDLRYNLVETVEYEYPPRTRKNIKESDGTLILNLGLLERGTKKTFNYAQSIGKPCFVVQIEADITPLSLRAWVERYNVKSLNIAGPRESRRPGIYEWAYIFLQSQLRKELKL